MKKLLVCFLLLCSSFVGAQTPKFPPGVELPSNLKQYFVVFFIEPDAAAARTEPDPALLKAHLATIRANIESGKYVLAGPFTDEGRIAGMFIVNVATKEEAQQLVSSDPVIKSGRATFEIHPAMFPDLSSLKITYPPKQSQ